MAKLNAGQILYAWYGDDFTGSTDVLQQLASNGVSSVLFLRRPSAEQMARFADVRAVGFAGDSRSRSPQWMREHLPEIFARLRELGARVNHYKVCSTFDSSPEVGSIGCAIELGLLEFAETPFVPVVVAAPHLRRYVCFGSLFAAGPDGDVVRIDRHPMRRHPVTPMLEADLRKHLALQTSEAVGLVDLTQLAPGDVRMPSERVVLFDGIDAEMNGRVGELVWREARERVVFSASSSGLTSALVHAWRANDVVKEQAVEASLPPMDGPLLVVSGSCSAATAGQIEWALANGFRGIAAPPAEMLENGTRVVAEASEALRAGLSTVVYTAMGSSEGSFGAELGTALGRLLADLVETGGVRRVVLCGGDTCSHAVQQMDAYALTWVADPAAGAPLCRVHSEDAHVDGMELVLKGGQVGGVEFFGRLVGGV